MTIENDAVIVAAVRTAVGKAKKGGLATMRPEEMGAIVVQEVLRRASGVDASQVEDILMGCAFPEGEQGMNVARLIGLRAGFPVQVAAETINRFCSSGLQSVAHAAYAIIAGQMEIVIAGGVESMSMVPMTGVEFSPSPYLAVHYPQAYTSMGLTAENVAEKYGISRAEQDAFALRSHKRAAQAVQEGLFEAEIVPVQVEVIERGEDGKLNQRRFTVQRDEGPRADTNLETLAKLRPAFKEGGTVTAGNSSQMSDGAAALLRMSRKKAEEMDIHPLARFVSFAVGGVAPEMMGIGPVEAIPKALKLAGLSLRDIDLIELNEAFAAQSLAVMRTLALDEERVNVNGGAIALGHPLGATGAKLLTQLIYEMKRRKARYGMVSMCVGGGMGAAGIFENMT